MTSIGDLLDIVVSRCRTNPAAPALTQKGGRRLTYGELGRELDSITAGLMRAGLQRGDAVVFSIRACPESIMLLLAIARCGGVVVAAEPGMSPRLFASRMSLLSPRWVMAESLLYALARTRPVRSALERRGVKLPNLDIPDARLLLLGPRLPWRPRALNYSDLLRGGPEIAPRTIAPDDQAAVVFTSGTTDAPKGVVHSGASIGAGIALIAEQLALDPADRVYSDQLHMVLPALMAGAEAVIPRLRRDVASELADLSAIRPTHAYWVPSALEQLLGAAGDGGRSLPESLKAVILGSAPAPSGFLRRCRDSVAPSTRIYCAYAMTEMLPVSWISLEEKLVYGGDGDVVGGPCRGVTVRIAADGEVMVAGPNLCTGYLGQPPLTELPTGDLGRLEGGRLVLLGRKKDMIIRGSHNIYPALIEGVVASVPGVRRCALVGVYDERTADELVVLALEAGDGVDPVELRSRVSRELVEGVNRIDVYARPDRIVVTPIPVSGRSFKTDKPALRQLVSALM